MPETIKESSKWDYSALMSWLWLSGADFIRSVLFSLYRFVSPLEVYNEFKPSDWRFDSLIFLRHLVACGSPGIC